MKNIRHLLFVMIVLTLVGCNKDVNVKLSKINQEFEAVGGTAEINLESNGAWQVNGCPDWLSISPMSGEGNATLSVTCAANTNSQERTAEIKVSTKNNEAALVVKQAFVEGNFITFSPEAIDCDFQGGEFQIAVEANCDWSVGTLPNWIHCEPMSGSHSANVMLTVGQYTFSSDGNREYNIDFMAGEEHYYLHVSQANDEEYHVVVTPNSVDFGAEGGSQTVVLQSITSWTAEGLADWISITPSSGEGNGEIAVSVQPNPNFEARNSRIVITSSVGCVTSLTVIQEAAINPHYLTINPTTLAFPYTESSLDLLISTDSLWSISSNEAWLSFSSQSGVGESTITVTASEHTLMGVRRAEIEVVSGSLQQTVFVTQESGYSEPILGINPNHLQISCEHESVLVSISANVDWDLHYSAGWIGVNQEHGVGDAEVQIDAKPNFGEEPRTCMVYLYHQEVVYDTLVIEQDARVYYVEPNVTELNATNQGDTFLIVVSANQDWLAVPNCGWVHVEPEHGSGDGSFRIVVDANNTPMSRTAEVRLSGSVSGVATIQINQSN